MADELHFDLTLYPDPVLRRTAEPVEAFDDDLRAIVAGMFERMYASDLFINEFIRPPVVESDLDDVVSAFEKVYERRGELRSSTA